MDIHKQVLDLFNDPGEEKFSTLALSLFRYQAKHNQVYGKYLQLINCDPSSIEQLADIPLLPIGLYKSQIVKTDSWQEQTIFRSSGTTGMERSNNYVKDLDWYQKISKSIFEHTCGVLTDYQIFGLLPSYVDNPSSSLLYMINYFMSISNRSTDELSNSDFAQLKEKIQQSIKSSDDKILLFGVTFALLDFAERHKIESKKLEIIFTGGMKNKRKELSFKEVYVKLKDAFPHSKIYSEYGMTELCSQAYSNEKGYYSSAATMKILAKEITDPLSESKSGKSARLGIIDLANIDTCAFILTDDIGVVHENSFEILGRMDNSDIRGCTIMYQSL